MTEVEVGVMSQLEGDPDPKNAGGLWKIEKARNRLSLGVSTRNIALLTSDFSLIRPIFGLLTSMDNCKITNTCYCKPLSLWSCAIAITRRLAIRKLITIHIISKNFKRMKFCIFAFYWNTVLTGEWVSLRRVDFSNEKLTAESDTEEHYLKLE